MDIPKKESDKELLITCWVLMACCAAVVGVFAKITVMAVIFAALYGWTAALSANISLKMEGWT